MRSLAENLAGRGHQITVVTSTAQTEQDFWLKSKERRNRYSESFDGSIKIIRCPLRGIRGGRRFLFAWRKAMIVASSLPGDQAGLLRRMAVLVPPISDVAETLHGLSDPYDIVHALNISWEHPLVQAWILARRRGLPLAVTPFIHVGLREQDRVARNSSMDHQRRVIEDANAIMVMTRMESEFLLRRHFNPRNVAIVGGGLDPLPESGDGQATLERFNLAAPLAVFVGRANYDKGAIHAVQAALSVREQGQPLTLAIIGQPSPDLDRVLARLTVKELEVIRPLGILDEVDKHTLLEAADMLLLPSQVESLGIVLLEAWAHGTPVIGARSGGIPAVIDENENGFLVDFGDVDGLSNCIIHLLTNPELGKRMGRRGRDKVAHEYTWDKVADRVLGCYEKILAAAD